MWQRESKRRYQIIKYCNKAEDTFIETSIKSENKDIQQHTNMSVHIYVCDINLPEFKLFRNLKKFLSISQEINSVHDCMLAKTQHILIVVANSCTQYDVKLKNIFLLIKWELVPNFAKPCKQLLHSSLTFNKQGNAVLRRSFERSRQPSLHHWSS